MFLRRGATRLTSVWSMAMFAPPMTVMLFSALASTPITAMPVGFSGSACRCVVATPAWVSRSRANVPKASMPVRPASSTIPPSRATATA